MTTRYMLPGQLEPEVEILGDQNPTVVPHNLVWVRHPELGVVQLDRTRLTEVKPPLPPEPHGNCCVLVENDLADADVEPDIYRRRDALWWPAGYSRIAGGGYTWAQLHGRGKVTVLRPDPADDAPELPFTAWDNSTESQVVTVEPSAAFADRLFVEVDPMHLDRKHVRQLAAALWAWAAREEASKP